MATIVRVKRRRDEDPLEVLHLAAKKQRQSAEESQAASSSVLGNLFKLAGTVNSKDSGVSQKVREAIRKEKLEKEYKRRQADVLGDLHTRNREQTRQSSVQNRFTVTAKHRAIALNSLDDILNGGISAEGPTENGDSYDEADKAKQKEEAKHVLNTDICEMCGKKIRKDKEEQNEDRCNCERDGHKNDADVERNRAKEEKDKTNETKGAERGSDTDKVTGDTNVNKNATAATGQGAIPKNTVETASTSDSSGVEAMYCLVDLEMERGPSYESLIRQDQIACNGQPMVREFVSENRDDGDYVYDIYYTNDRTFDFRMFENDLSFEALGNAEAWRPELVDDEYVYEDDDDDENAESNWRNDYPDEDPGFLDNRAMDYVYPDDMAQLGGFDTEATNHLADWMSWRCNLEDGAELSSDENEVEQYERAGSSYEAYYRNVKKQMDADSD